MTTEHELADAHRAAHAAAQRVTELEAELAHTAPVATAAHAYCAALEVEATVGDWHKVHALQVALLAAHRATTPSPVPSSHVIVERARLERLEAIEKAAQGVADREKADSEMLGYRPDSFFRQLLDALAGYR